MRMPRNVGKTLGVTTLGLTLFAGMGLPVATAAGNGPTAADNAAISYVDATYPGSGQASILKTEPDVDRGVAVYDVRVLAPNGTTYVVHIQQSNDTVLWANRAESQSTSSTGGASADQVDSTGQPSKDHTPSPSGQSASAQISSQQAVAAAEGAVSNQAGVKKERLHNQDGKNYYQIKLRLQPHGTTNVWVDASTTTPVVTAIQGHGYSMRDSQLVAASTADTNALQAVGGGTVLHTSLHGGKWRFYEVQVRTSSGTKEKVWESAATGAVTQMKAS
ncbi:MAG: PepSY domain-containing protein [Chloroflexi bacterium]|nr:PepSY domain-containing protein [Chloroflexota bacterium]